MYFTSNSILQHPIIQKADIRYFGISDVTISKTFRKIWPYHKIVLNNKITELILEKKNATSKTSSDINKNNLIINNDSESEEKPKKKSVKGDKKNLIINEDSDEDNSENDYDSDSDESDESDEDTQNKKKFDV